MSIALDPPALLHDPLARLDYAFDWTLWLLPGETITAAVWTISDSNMSATAITPLTTKPAAWVTGIPVVNRVRLSCRITTSQGRDDRRGRDLLVRDR